VESGGPNFLRTRRAKRRKLRYEVGSRSASEGYRQDVIWRQAGLEEARNAAHESEGLASARARDDTQRSPRIGCDL